MNPVPAELSTQQAAEVLNVSSSHLINLLDKGAIPYRKAGLQRQVRLEDVLGYKQKTDQKRLETLAELSALDQELGFGYQP